MYRVLPRFNDIYWYRDLCGYFEIPVFCFFRYRILIALRTFHGIGVYVVISRCQYFAFFATEFSLLSGHFVVLVYTSLFRGTSILLFSLVFFRGGLKKVFLKYKSSLFFYTN